MLRYTKTTNHARSPVRSTNSAAGVDLCSAHDYFIYPGRRALVSTDLQIAVPEGCYGRLAARSGLATNHSIDVGAGVIDADYRGVVYVLLINNGTKIFRVKQGMRIAQLICEKIVYTEPILVPSLEETERGAAGFGSTGYLNSESV